VSPSIRRLAAGPAAALLVLLLALPALAHAELVSSTPEDGATLATPPTVVEVRFSEGLDAAKSSLRLVGPEGEVARGGLNRDGGRVLRIDDLALAAGAYTVRWTIGSEDGHVERGTLRFTVDAPTPAPATAVPPSATPSTAASTVPSFSPTTPAPATDAPATPAPQPSGSDAAPVASSGADVLIPIVAGLALVAVAGAFLLRRSRGA
jgi:methionine-rich copper-binding protein CopC